VLSKLAASAVYERLWDEYQAFAQRDLGDLDIVYLFLDGVAERLHLGQPHEAVLAGKGDRQRRGQAPAVAAAEPQGEHRARASTFCATSRRGA
jgi:hypothetical protein